MDFNDVEKARQVLVAAFDAYTKAQVSYNQIMVSTLTDVVTHYTQPPQAISAKPEPPKIEAKPTPPAPTISPPPTPPAVVLPETAQQTSCFGFFDGTNPECKACDEARKCAIATMAKGGNATPPVPPQVPQQIQGGIQATPEEEAQLQGLELANRNFVLELARTEKKSIPEIRQMLRL